MMQDKQSVALDRYQEWLHDPVIDAQTKQELQSISGQFAEIEDRFFKELEFGTGGLRGVIGAGTNRMNLYTVGKSIQGLAEYLKNSSPADTPKVVIAYDSRQMSSEFALRAALILAGNGIRAYVFETLRPTPQLSFAVRELHADAGIMITASHNPPEYNGLKVYGPDGGQLVPKHAEQVMEHIRQVRSFAEIQQLSREEAEQQGYLRWLGQDMDERYITAVLSTSQNEQPPASHQDLKIIYTPLHGTGNIPVRQVLQRSGFTQVHVVPEQEQPDAYFSTVQSPNPEEEEAFAIALNIAKDIDADLIIGTDPDCDRMGAVVKNDQGQFVVLTGNQIGALITYYLLSRLQEKGQLPRNGTVIKTIVTSELGAKIAESFGVTVINTLTGFKYIGEKMTQFERTGEYQFIFGYEESYGYLAGNYCRDKDAVVACMLISEAAAFYHHHGKTLYDVLQELYQTHGTHIERLESRTLKGKQGLEQMGRIMQAFRQDPPAKISGVRVRECKDYLLGIEGLPKENVLKYVLEDGSWFCLRPSGTEPKIKIYFGIVGSSTDEAQTRMEQLVNDVIGRLEQIG